MKSSEKRLILIIVIVGIVLIAGILIWKKSTSKPEEEQQPEEKYVQVLEDGTKLNNSSKLNSNKTVDGMELSNIQLTYQNGICRVYAQVTNTTTQDKDLTPVIVTLYNDSGKELKKMNGLISPLKVGETTELDMTVNTDYANSYDFTIEKAN